MKDDKKKQKVVIALDPISLQKMEAQADNEADDKKGVLFSILDDLKKNDQNYGDTKTSEYRLAFDENPILGNNYTGLYKNKVWLLPDAVIKKLRRTDDLVASILHARSNYASVFGRPRQTRFDLGFDIVVHDKQFLQEASPAQLKRVADRIAKAKQMFLSCGSNEGFTDRQRLNFSQFLKQFTYDGVSLGRAAVEIIYKKGPDGEDKVFHAFRPVDAETIHEFNGINGRSSGDAIRVQALELLKRLAKKDGKELDVQEFDKKIKDNSYAYVQVIQGQPRQVFNFQEMVVHNFYAVTDIEYNGYPLTPLDTIINAVTTHINISQHNKLYFQSGRAAKGILVFQSDSIDEHTLGKIRLQFNASINSVANAHRMPVFGVGTEDSVQWLPIDHSGTRDKEFAILADSNARTILSAFQMSPDELPGYGHLSKGTNSSSLSESNNEYKLTASRDVGLRPLIATIQDFINENLFKLIDPDLSKVATVVLAGLESDDPIKESQKIEAGIRTYYSMNDILEMVDKERIEEEWGGDLPFNAQYQALLDKYFTVGQIKARFFKDKKAEKDPALAYYRDPFWMQYQQILQQKQAQEQAAQQQAQGQLDSGEEQPVDGQEGDQGLQEDSQPNQEDSQPNQEEQQSTDDQIPEGQEDLDLSTGIDQIMDMLNKSENKNLPMSRKRLLAQSRATTMLRMKEWEKESEALLKDVMLSVGKFTKKKKD